MSDLADRVEIDLAGLLLFHPTDWADEIRAGVIANDFRTEQGKAIFQSVCRRMDAGESTGSADIMGDCRKAGAEISEETLQYLSGVLPSCIDVPESVRILHRAGGSRRLQAVLNRSLDRLSRQEDPETVLADLNGDLGRLSEEVGRTDLVTSAETTKAVMDLRWKVETGNGDCFLRTGFPRLDNVLGGGLKLGGVYVVGGRTGVGKTAFALAIADNVARVGRLRVLFITLEMNPVDLAVRRTAMLSGIDSKDIFLKKPFSDEENEKLLTALECCSKTDLMYNREFRLNVGEIGILARRSKCDLLVIDYLGLIQSKSVGRQYEKITDISNDLRSLALSLNVPILCLSQLNRQGVPDEAPEMTELKDSSSIEQDAAGVLLLYRQMGKAADGATVLSCVVPKMRWGEVDGHVDFLYDPRCNLIKEVAYRKDVGSNDG